MAHLKVLLSAYACEPGKGSEPGVGWNMARQIAQRHEVWAVTRANNRPMIEAELARNPVPSLHMVYYDLPRWARWWKRQGRGVQLYYYLWQLGIYDVVRRLHREIGFDLTHHVTFVKYWRPSLLAFVPAPFVWGPLGGAESAPGPFRAGLRWRGRLYEVLRGIARWSGERDPLVVRAARRSALALAVTPDTAERLHRLGAKRVRILSEAALHQHDIAALSRLAMPDERPHRVVSIGRMLHWKGFHLGLRAFAAAAIPTAEYWLVGDGPEESYLRRLAESLGITDRVRFWGALPRRDVLTKLAQAHVLVHPSLHDSGGWVCLEAMAAGRPVICLDLGGPAQQVTRETGMKIPARTPPQAVRGMAQAMVVLANDPRLRARLGQAGKDRVASQYSWERRGELLSGLYRTIAGGSQSDTSWSEIRPVVGYEIETNG